jgi:Ca-activated chloride channel family protein
MWVDGEPIEGQILPAQEARKIYEDIVRRRRDPALLEYIGQDAVQVRIYPIPAGGSRRIELEYTEMLEADNGLVKYRYPLNTEKFSARPLEDCSVRIELISKQALHSVYSPTHQDRIFIDRENDHRVVIGYEETNLLPDQDFDLIYTFSDQDIGINLLTYPDTEFSGNLHQEGYFLLMAAPKVSVDRIVPRDILLVLDTSGSMEGEKIQQAKAAAHYIMEHLNPEDRFNVIAFSTSIKRFAMDLQPISKASEASSWIETLEALGGTNINLALLEGLTQQVDFSSGDGGRPLVLLFLTDGLPTEGVTEIDQILANVKAASGSNLRLFAFGVGDDVNTLLLDRLAEENRGVTSYVRPQERIDEEVSGLYAKIQTPVLTDIKLDFGSIQAEELYPPVLPDLFSGTQLILTGRYRLPLTSSGTARITLSGYVNGRRTDYSYQVDFSPGESSQHSFIPRLWAARKIGYLLSQIRLKGENQEWVDAIIQLSLQYGIITPYTSFLVEEHEIMASEEREEAAKELILEFAAPLVGSRAVDQADAESNLRSAESIAQPSLPDSDPVTGIDQPEMRFVENKTFLLRDEVWVDTTYDPDTMPLKRIGFGSEVYFDLLTAQPAWGKFLALGEQVIFVVGGTAYEIGEGPGDFQELPPELSLPTDQLPDDDSHSTSRPSGLRSICSGPLLLGMALVGLIKIK